MRILVVSNLYPPDVRGGYEVECRDNVEHLRGRHEVTVLASDHERARWPEQDGVLRRMPFAEDTRASILRAPLAALRGVKVMREVLAEQRPDLVYVWNAAGLPMAALHVLHRSGAPVAYRVCEHWFGGIYDTDFFMKYLTGPQRGRDALWAPVPRAVNRLPSLRVGDHAPVPAAICWNGEFLRTAVPTPRVLAPVLEHVVYPINAAADAMADVPRRPVTDPPVVLFVGRVGPEKGIDVAIRAVAELERGHGVVAALRVVGPGDAAWRTHLEELARQEGVAGRVRFTGPLRGAELHEQVSRASVWVVPSVWEEPAPMVCVEAGLARVPLVASRVGGIPEMLRDDDEARIFANRDATGCAAALAEALSGDPATQERVRRGRIRAQELSFVPYLERMDRFLDEAAAALGVPSSGAAPAR
jgi:glycosyltransferase involved in cell wall biosynthesis